MAMTPPLDSAWADRLALWLTDRFGMAEPVVEHLRRPTSGYSSETVFFDTTWLDGYLEYKSIYGAS